ncbi:MAG: UDP-N-acetylmuramoyl-tripeptide--D-alanyl-D-alanine ligase [Patescibacteria group bacterium]
MVYWFKIIYFLLLLQAISRCLYFWQLKEYRWDRFRAMLATSARNQYLLPSLQLFRPRLTFKILILFYLSFYFSFLFHPLLAYLLLPLTVSLAVLFLAPLTGLLYDLIILAAKIKLLFYKKLTVIGITGSYGKTSTKEILSHILASKYPVLKTPLNSNTTIGVALTILKSLNSTHQYFVVEMGAYRLGEIAAICRLVKPKIGILTGINEQHLGLFGSQENIIKAKSELLLALPKNGLAVVNGVNQFTKKLAISQAPTKFYGYAKQKINLLGQGQQLNLSAAIIVAQYLGIKKFDLTHLPQLKSALTLTKGLNQATIINDSYNSNPAGFNQAIKYVSDLPFKTKILITPGIIELGSQSAKIHRQLAAQAKPVFDQIFVTKPEIAPYFQVKTGSEADLLQKLTLILTKNHLLLIEGRFSAKFIKVLCSNQS